VDAKLFVFEHKHHGKYIGTIEIEPTACQILKTDDGKYVNAVIFKFDTHEEVEAHSKKIIARVLDLILKWEDTCVIIGPTPESRAYYQNMFMTPEGDIKKEVVKKFL